MSRRTSSDSAMARSAALASRVLLLTPETLLLGSERSALCSEFTPRGDDGRLVARMDSSLPMKCTRLPAASRFGDVGRKDVKSLFAASVAHLTHQAHGERMMIQRHRSK
jgi:hypothetical protein